MTNVPDLAMPQAAQRSATEPGDPFWFRWEIVLPLAAVLTFLASMAGFVDRMKSATE